MPLHLSVPLTLVSEAILMVEALWSTMLVLLTAVLDLLVIVMRAILAADIVIEVMLRWVTLRGVWHLSTPFSWRLNPSQAPLVASWNVTV